MRVCSPTTAACDRAAPSGRDSRPSPRSRTPSLGSCRRCSNRPARASEVPRTCTALAVKPDAHDRRLRLRPRHARSPGARLSDIVRHRAVRRTQRPGDLALASSRSRQSQQILDPSHRQPRSRHLDTSRHSKTGQGSRLSCAACALDLPLPAIWPISLESVAGLAWNTQRSEVGSISREGN